MRVIADRDHLAKPWELAKQVPDLLQGVLPAEHDRRFRVFQDVTLLLSGFFDVDRHDCHADGPGGKVHEHRLVVVEKDRRHPIAAPQAQALAQDGGGPSH